MTVAKTIADTDNALKIWEINDGLSLFFSRGKKYSMALGNPNTKKLLNK